MALGLFRLIASLARDRTVATNYAPIAFMAVYVLNGFVVPKGKYTFHHFISQLLVFYIIKN